MQVEIETDVVSYRREVERFAKLTGISLQDAMREGAAILSVQLAKKFPPNKLATGRKAIRNDLNRIIISDQNVMLTAEMDNESHMLLFKSGAKIAIENHLFRPEGSVSDIRRHHEASRVGARRRPSKRAGKSYERRGMTHSPKLYVPKSSAGAYLRERQKHVGKLKGRWTAAAVRYPGAAKVPKWIAKHPDKGRVIDRMKANGDGYIELINTTPYASNWADVNAFVVRSQKRMFRNRINAALKKNAEAHNRRAA